MLLFAPALILFAWLIEPIAAKSYPSYDYGLSSPSFFLLRLGIVMALCAGMFYYERWKSISQNPL